MSDTGYIYFDGIGSAKGGLCDRLKGMYSCFALSQKLNKKFYYNMPHPVALKMFNFEQPKDAASEELYIVDWENYLKYENRIKELDFQLDSYKIHTNIDFVDKLNLNLSFSNFLKTFFDLKSFEKEKNIFKYDIGLHIRCGGKMVPWSDYDFGIEFNEALFVEKIKNICEDSDKEVFICSDSEKVLSIADSLKLKNLTTSPNIPKHIDRAANVDEMDYINVFYDLLTLAKSKLIYHTQGEFAKTAARIYENKIRSF